MASLLSIGVQAMFANQAALQSIGQNIANANTPGYSRQQVVLTTPPGQSTGAGFFGKGVVVQTVIRSHDAFLTREAVNTKSLAYMDSMRMDMMSQLEKVFPLDETGLGAAASSFFNAMIDVASRPSDASARQVVLGTAANLAARFTGAAQQLVDIQSGVVSTLKANVGIVNQLAEQIAATNDQISRTNGTGHTPNDLLDQRDQLISKLSEYVQVTTLPASDGSLGVFIGGGQRLVLGSQSLQLNVATDPYDTTRAQLNIVETSGNRPVSENMLTGGSISALLQFQNKDLQDARNYIGQIAAAMVNRVNGQQALGLDLSDPPGKGVPIFAAGQPRVLPAATNARDGQGKFTAGVRLSITDASQLQASSYKLSPNLSGGAGTYTLTRLSDGFSRTVAEGDTVDGFRINFAPAAPGPSDSFLLEPVANAALDMARVLDQTSGIAAASPLTASTNINNKGTATVESIYAVNPLVDPTQAPMTVLFGEADPDNPTELPYTITLADGSELNGTWSAGQPIGNQPNAGEPINLGFELKLNGVPRAGDSITVDPTKFTATNNGNAKAYLNLQTSGIVGQRLQPDGSITPGLTITDAYATAMSEIGARTQGATYLANVSTAVAADAEATRSGMSGVNIDEEAARLMQFQQGYQAAAKILQTAQQLFDELLQLTGR